jgi:hypothetical protein
MRLKLESYNEEMRISILKTEVSLERGFYQVCAFGSCVT